MEEGETGFLSFIVVYEPIANALCWNESCHHASSP